MVDPQSTAVQEIISVIVLSAAFVKARFISRTEHSRFHGMAAAELVSQRGGHRH